MPDILRRLFGKRPAGRKPETRGELARKKIEKVEEPLIPRGFKVVERYSIYEPFVHAVIVQNPETGETRYVVDELKLTRREKFIYDRVVETLQWELKPLTEVEDPYSYFKKMAARVIHKYRLRLGRLPGISWSKILYYVERNLLGYGPIDPLMRDPNLEDISCDGVGKPVYVWHRRYESIPTNIVFRNHQDLDEFIIRLAHKAGKHISIAWPILDAMLPEMHRLAATFSREVSTSGSTFTIRKFREDPITIIDMINFKTLDAGTAAYLWIAMEYKMPAMIMGVTGSGKSVSGKSRILAVVDGIPGVFTVEEIWKRFSDKALKLGTMEIIVEPEVLVRTFDSQSLKAKWVKPRYLIRHRNDKKMYRVLLASGRYVDLTEDHSLLIFDGIRFREAKPIEDIIGVYVPIPRSPIGPAKLSLRKVLKLLDKEKLYVHLDDNVRRLLKATSEHLAGQTKLLEVLGCKSTGSFRQKRLRLEVLARLLESLPDITLEDVMVSSRQGTPLKLLDTLLKPEFAALLGYYVSEGYRDNGNAVITTSDVEIVAELCARLGYPCKVSQYNGKTPRIVIGGTLGRLILATGAGDVARNKRLPLIYWAMPLEWKVAFLRAYIDGDGHIGARELEISSASEQLAWDLVFAFSELGITATLRRKRIRDRLYYRVIISTYYYGRLAELGIISTKHVKKKKYAWSRFDDIPASLIASDTAAWKEISLMSKKGRLALVKMRFLRGGMIAKQTLARLIERSGLELQHLARYLDPGVAFDRVVDVMEAKQEEFVYDFEIPGTQTFEANNVIVHNTTLLNSLTCMFRPTIKVVSIEDTPELRLPLDNWVQLVSRPSYGLGPEKVGEVTLFDLVKVSLRYRPDIIIVGEVRGEEAYVLFQALASVSGDTPVLIRGPDGKVRLVEIGEFVDQFYAEGEERIAKRVEGFEVLSHNGFQAVWKPVKYVLRHSTDKIYRVVVESGAEIRATGSHSVFVADPETLEIKEKPVKEIKPGELLITYTEVPLQRRSARPVIRTARYLRRKIGATIVEASTGSATLLVRGGGHGLPRSIELDEDLAYVFGVYIADGCVKHHRGSRICLTLGNKENGIAERVTGILWRKFGVKPTVTRRRTYTIYEFNHTLLAELFEKLMGSRLEEKRVPDPLWEAPASVVRAFFEGLRADSRRTLKRRYINYATANRRLAQELVWLARLHGWYSEMYVEKGTGKNHGKQYYNVNIYFDKQHKRPNAAEKIPVKPLLKLAELAEAKSMPFELTYVRRRKYVSRKVAEKLLQWITSKGRIEGKATELYRRILDYMNGKLRVIEVRRIEVEDYKGYVYDLSVPETESFFGGNTPVLLHNTGHGGITTIHAESVDAAVKRLTSPPMNIPEGYIPLMKLGIIVKRVRIFSPDYPAGRIARRVSGVYEIKDVGRYEPVVQWNPFKDTFDKKFRDSMVLREISESIGKTYDELIEEMSRRSVVLQWMAWRGIRDYREVARVIQAYYANSEKVFKHAEEELAQRPGF